MYEERDGNVSLFSPEPVLAATVTLCSSPAHCFRMESTMVRLNFKIVRYSRSSWSKLLTKTAARDVVAF